jgi:hypothetical protein
MRPAHGAMTFTKLDVDEMYTVGINNRKASLKRFRSSTQGAIMAELDDETDLSQ